MAGADKWASIRHRTYALRRGAIAAADGAGVGQQAQRPQGPSRRLSRVEAYGPGGTALMVDFLTDSPEQMISRLRALLAGFGGLLGAPGSVSYLFNEVGVLLLEPGADLPRLLPEALRAGAEDVVVNADGSLEVLTDPSEFAMVRAALLQLHFAPVEAVVTYRASTPIRLGGASAQAMLGLLAALDDLNEIQNVYTNAEISDELLARI